RCRGAPHGGVLALAAGGFAYLASRFDRRSRIRLASRQRGKENSAHSLPNPGNSMRSSRSGVAYSETAGTGTPGGFRLPQNLLSSTLSLLITPPGTRRLGPQDSMVISDGRPTTSYIPGLIGFLLMTWCRDIARPETRAHRAW